MHDQIFQKWDNGRWMTSKKKQREQGEDTLEMERREETLEMTRVELTQSVPVIP